MVEEIPESYIFMITYNQLIVEIIKLHILPCITAELKQAFFGDKVIFINLATYRKEDDVHWNLRDHLHMSNLTVDLALAH